MREVIAGLLRNWADEVENGLTLDGLEEYMDKFMKENEMRAKLPEYQDMFEK